MTNDELRTEMVDRFDKVHVELEDRFEKAHLELEEVLSRVHQAIAAEGETTRRHFDIMVEKMRDSVKIVAETTDHHAVRLDNHEKRLKRLERPRRS